MLNLGQRREAMAPGQRAEWSRNLTPKSGGEVAGDLAFAGVVAVAGTALIAALSVLAGLSTQAVGAALGIG